MHNGKWGCGCILAMIAKILVIVGGLNWGILGLGMLMGKMTDWNVVNMLLGSWPMVEAIVYLLVGIAAVVQIFGCPCKKCQSCTCGVDPKMGQQM